MKTLSTYQLVCKIRGNTDISPVGATHVDEHRLESQYETQELARYLIDDITGVAQTRGQEWSKEHAKSEAIIWLKEVKNYIDEIIEESEEE